ncbi:MAG: CD3337/EF1877 family mobilome membrane protein [Leuconostoc lactis]|uniref:CD3337/EF1877 family mobilome membrane protein n=1 Tax=Leuconostoc lactis TaxID=1246 RepID=UPI003995AF22
MKKIVFSLAVLIATVFFVPINQANADNIGNSSNNSPLKQKVDEQNGKQSSSDDKTTTPQNSLGTNTKNGLGQDVKETNSISNDGSAPNQTKEEIIKNFSIPDMDWVNANVVPNMRMYHETGSITEFGLGAAHVATDILTALNLYIVYPLFDKALSVMFNLSNITNSLNSVFTDVQNFAKTSFASKAFQSIVYTFFGIGLVWVFIKQTHTLKNGLIIFLILVGGTAWINSGGLVLQKVNQLTSMAQVQVFQATKDLPNGTADTGNGFQNALRKEYYAKAVERPFALGNFGTVDVDKAGANNNAQGDPYRLMGGGVDDTVIKSFAGKNHYISKDGGQEWYQASIALMSAPMSVAYGIPLLMIGVANLLVQLGAILLYYLAPFTIMLSMIPKFANSFLKTMLGALGLLLAKVGLLFGVMFVSWVGAITDAVVPVQGSASAMLNSIVYIILMVLLWKNKSWLVQAITGSSVANNAMNKISLTKSGRKVLDTAGQMGASVQNTYGKARHLRNQYQDNRKNNKRDGQDEPDEPKRPRQRDDDNVPTPEQREAQQKAREQRLADYDRVNTEQPDKTDTPPVRQKNRTTDEQPLPAYRRSMALRTPVVHENATNSPEQASESTRPKVRVNDETIAKTQSARQQARSQTLRQDETINVNEKLAEAQAKRQARLADLDKEL